MLEKDVEARGLWSSKFGFILAAAGSAIGLGNIWRFPYTTGQNGGGAFLVLYLICIILLGLPIMIAELAIGRHSRRDPVGAFEVIRPGSPWKLIGYMGVTTGICILSYYSVLAGYTVGYIGKSLAGNSTSYEAFTSNPLVSIPLFLAFIVITVLVVQGGVKNGIERWARILMPTLMVLLVILIIRSITLKGAGEGLAFYFKPDFSKVTGSTVLAALGQAFFSLSLGMGAMITYGSYLSKDDNLVASGCYVAFFDTLIAVMAGLLIFPAIFAMNMSPDEGPGLVFKVLPRIFGLIPGGRIVGAFFFILLSIAALTSTISLLEVVTSYLVDEKHWLRRKAVWIVAAVTFLLGLPAALSQEGMVPWLAKLPGLGTSFLGFMDWLFGNIMLGIGAVFIAIFTGWVWKKEISSKELREGFPGFDRIAPVLFFLLRFFCPVVILIVLFFIFKAGV
ncbi:MAG: sodium-dependent transporter [Candidatus Krumholzibacteriota bacterium]|nr:sodium-dependent transporter [Candidatus Krumholzibacteriota bacterium]